MCVRALNVRCASLSVAILVWYSRLGSECLALVQASIAEGRARYSQEGKYLIYYPLGQDDTRSQQRH